MGAGPLTVGPVRRQVLHLGLALRELCEAVAALRGLVVMGMVVMGMVEMGMEVMGMVVMGMVVMGMVVMGMGIITHTKRKPQLGFTNLQ